MALGCQILAYAEVIYFELRKKFPLISSTTDIQSGLEFVHTMPGKTRKRIKKWKTLTINHFMHAHDQSD